MKRAAIIGLALCASLVVSGCGSSGGVSVDPGAQTSHGAVAQSPVLTKDRLDDIDGAAALSDSTENHVGSSAERDPYEENDVDASASLGGASESEDLDGEEEDETGLQDSSGGPIKVVAPDIGGTSVTQESPKYAYQDFILEQAGSGNAVFSGESFLTSLDMWCEMIEGEQKDILTEYVTRDYLGFDDTDGLTFLNRIWIDDSLSPSSSRLSEFYSVIDMSSPSATSQKNQWVSKSSDGFITYTPSVLSEDSIMDMMSVLSFSSGWSGGTKPYDTRTRIFYNADGTESKTVMIHDESLTYWQLDDAKAYCMYFEDGSYVMIILPDKGADFSKIDLAGLMSGKIPSKKAHVNFYMPSFTLESTYQFSPNDFGLPEGTVKDGIISGLPDDYSPVFSQIAKVSLTNAGAGNAQAGTAVSFAAADESLDTVDIVCNRPFMFYVGDAENEDIALFGVVNELTDDMLVSEEQAGLQ